MCAVHLNAVMLCVNMQADLGMLLKGGWRASVPVLMGHVTSPFGKQEHQHIQGGAQHLEKQVFGERGAESFCESAKRCMLGACMTQWPLTFDPLIFVEHGFKSTVMLLSFLASSHLALGGKKTITINK